MGTSAQDRLDMLFKNQPRPSPPANGELSIVDLDLQEERAKSLSSWNISDDSQVSRNSRNVQQERRPSYEFIPNPDEDDDNLAALETRHTMKSAAARKIRRVKSECDVEDCPKDAITQTDQAIEFIPQGKSASNVLEDETVEHIGAASFGRYILPTKDKYGNRVNGHYCIFPLVAKFPYKYLEDPSDRVSRHFFSNNKFYEREWDLYYLYPPASSFKKELILVPHAQVQNLMDEINSTLNLNLTVPPPPFTVSFFEYGTPHPRLLGTSTDRDQATELQNSVPSPDPDHGECPEGATPQLQENFKRFAEKWEMSLQATKKSKAAKKKSKAADRLLAKINVSSQLRRIQRYLGLRPRSTQPPLPDPGLSWSEQQEFEKEQRKKCHIDLDPLDVSVASPYQFDKDPVIIAFDVEAYERAHHIITEVGVSTLDTLDLVNIAPGPNGENWMKQIRSRHFRIKDRQHLVNRDFCPGDPEGFQFGESEILDVLEVRDAVDSCFEWPFSIAYKHDGSFKVWDDDTGMYVQPGRRAKLQEAQKGSKERNIIIVGHHIGQDLTYLESLGSKIFSAQRNTYPVPAMETYDGNENIARILASIIEPLDTANLYRALKQEQQTRGLSSVVLDLGLDPRHMHNAGNDARYTLMALVGMAVKACLQGDAQKTSADQEATWSGADVLSQNQPDERVLPVPRSTIPAADSIMQKQKSSNSTGQTGNVHEGSATKDGSWSPEAVRNAHTWTVTESEPKKDVEEEDEWEL